MICRDSFRILSDEEKAQYKFEFCQGCALYGQCELVQEYTQFKNNHSPNPESRIPQTPSGVPKINATAIRIGGREIAPSPSSVSTAVGGVLGMDKLSYDQEKSGQGCIIKSTYPIACDTPWVAEGIRKHYQIEIREDYTHDIVTSTTDRWEPLQPVFISAPTGRGKTSFIENTLIPYVEELNYRNNTEQRVLIISNRLALQEQMKRRLEGKPAPKNKDEEIYHPFRGCADVITYQGLLCQEGSLMNKQKNPHSRYIYVICDEAHFVTSDAMFNPDTDEILEAIVRLFKKAVRVYMSATPYECLEYIIEHERKYRRLKANNSQEKDKSIPMVFYHFKRDYSYLDVKTYSSISELYRQIVDSVNKRREKWLIFIDDKQKGAAVKGKLLEYEKEYAKEYGWSLFLNGGAEESTEGKKEKISKAEAQAKRILAVNANSKDDETYMSIIKDEKLGRDTYVLITTSVLDNGVNLTDINNIVVSDMSKVKCLQMVGRARVSGKDDRKTLYIKRFGGGEVSERLRHFNRQKEAYHLYNLAYGESHDRLRPREGNIKDFINKFYHGSGDDWHDANHWFGRSSDEIDKLYLNEIAKSLLDRLIPWYEFIRDEMLEEGPLADDETQRKEQKNYSGQKYLEYQLSWFGKTYHPEDDLAFVDNVIENKPLVAFLEAYADSGETVEGKEKMTEFQTEFKRLHDAVYPSVVKDKTHPYGYKVMNDILKNRNLGYEIAGQPQKGPWTVIRVDANCE